MKQIALVFSTTPRGTAAGWEGLDTLLATSALTDDLAVFFIADSVFQLLLGQKPDAVLACDYVVTFKLLNLCDIGQCWVCAASPCERGLDPQTPFAVETTLLEVGTLHREFADYDVISKS